MVTKKSNFDKYGIPSKGDIATLQKIEDEMYRLQRLIVRQMELRTEMRTQIVEDKKNAMLDHFVDLLKQLNYAIEKNTEKYYDLDIARGSLEENYTKE